MAPPFQGATTSGVIARSPSARLVRHSHENTTSPFDADPSDRRTDAAAVGRHLGASAGFDLDLRRTFGQYEEADRLGDRGADGEQSVVGSGRAWWIGPWMQNAAGLIATSPSSATVPSGRTSTRSATVAAANATPSRNSQNDSLCTGSRALM